MVSLSQPIRGENDVELTNEKPGLCTHLATVGCYQNVNIATHTSLVLMIQSSGGLRAHSELLRMAQNILGPSQVIVVVKRGA